MAESSATDILLIPVGAIMLYLGLSWKRPSYAGGNVRKFGLIFVESFFIVYGIISVFRMIFLE